MNTLDMTNVQSLDKGIDDIIDALERIKVGILSVRSFLLPETDEDRIEFDPRDPANKFDIGGTMKLTDQGVEVCYRLFDMGKSRYAVCKLMDISFGAATHRYTAWEKLGGQNRKKAPLE